MIGLVIATHGNLGSALLQAAEMILGPVECARTVGINREDSVESVRAALESAVGEVRSRCQVVLIMTDMFGGTPANLAISFLQPNQVEVLTGVNLPMVLKFFNSRAGLSVVELAGMLKAYGQQSMVLASEFLEK